MAKHHLTVVSAIVLFVIVDVTDLDLIVGAVNVLQMVSAGQGWHLGVRSVILTGGLEPK